ncbi:MAG: ABC transporter permease [Candidatus Ratteibacteria bacterium]|jgi:lipoprotein-releasing system permease protein
MNGYLFFLARRFLGKRRQESFIWYTSIISVVGIALGVASLMVVLGVMNGFSTDLRTKVIGANPHIMVEGNPYLSDYQEVKALLEGKVPEILSIRPFAQTQVIFRSSRYMIGGFMKGLDMEEEGDSFSIYLKEGEVPREGEIMLGSELSEELGVCVGDSVGIVGGFPATQSDYRVAGILEYGVYAIDSSLGVISLQDFQRAFFGNANIANLGLTVQNIYRSEKTAATVSKILGDRYKVSTWIRKNKILFAALALEKKAMFLILAIIVLVASFNIASTLMMTVYRKIREIGVLKTLGLSAWEIRRLFLLQGAILGVRGLILGLSAGGILVYILKRYRFIRLPEYIYSLSYLPMQISLSEILGISGMVLVMTLLASAFPAHRAGRLDPATTLRYE